jgi:hypothetical protein
LSLKAEDISTLKSQSQEIYYLKEDAHAEAPEAGEAEAEDDVEEQEFHPGEEGSPHQLTGFAAHQNSNFNVLFVLLHFKWSWINVGPVLDCQVHRVNLILCHTFTSRRLHSGYLTSPLCASSFIS